MIRFPNCKINLGLSVNEKLPDGYHLLETVFYPLGLSDMLEIIPCQDETRLTITGVLIPGNISDNLCFKAWRLMNETYNLGPVHIHLHKIIPTGAGLGGGSADAAFTLSMISDLFNLKLPVETLMKLAARLGMDCPYFILNEPAIGMGKGEMLQPISLNLKGFYLVLVRPAMHISTAEAYSGVEPSLKADTISNIIHEPVAKWKNLLINDFEKSVFEKYPEIGHIKDKLYQKGALYASMSGSGSAVYGLFTRKPELAAEFSGNFVWGEEL